MCWFTNGQLLGNERGKTFEIRIFAELQFPPLKTRYFSLHLISVFMQVWKHFWIYFAAHEDLTRVRTEFLSISRCPHLTQIEKGSLASLKDLKTLTLNSNTELKYIAPNFIKDAPNLAALDLSQNSLYALEYGAVEPVLSKLRALYLNGNKFNCHCSLRWLAQLLIASNSKVQHGEELKCSNNGHDNRYTLLSIFH